MLRRGLCFFLSRTPQQVSSLLAVLYSHQDISQRVRALKELPANLLPIPEASLCFEVPTAFRLTTAKQLNQFHKANRTAPNLIILHALAYIEFNAFMAYADTLLRFGHAQENHSMRDKMTPEELQAFRQEIQRVAIDEGEHCLLLKARVEELGYQFGEFPVISNLTNTVKATQDDVRARLALISIVHEGKGIKSIKRLIQKVKSLQDHRSESILAKIDSEETFHYQCGLKWFRYFCEARFGAGDQLLDVVEQINRKFKVNIDVSQIIKP